MFTRAYFRNHMANPAAEARAQMQSKWSGATVSARGKNSITHQHDQPWLWKMVKNDFHAYAMPGNDAFDAGQIIRYVDPVSEEEITFQPQQIQWSNDLDQIDAVADPATISGGVVGDELIWDSAYGPGINFEWQAQTARMQKRIVVDTLAALGSPPQFIIDGGNPYLRIPFIFQKTSGVEIWIGGVEWDEKANNPQLTAGTVEFKDSGGLLFSMAQPWAKGTVDESNAPDQLQGIYSFHKTGPNLFIEVRIPWVWLELANYPVVVDPSIDYQVGASADDAGEGSTGGMNLTNVSHNVDDRDEWFGARWTGVTIPDGDTIDLATVDMKVVHSSQDDAQHELRFEDGSTPGTFTSSSGDISGRTYTTAFYDWDDINMGVGNGAWISTAVTLPDLSAIVQELQDSYDYSSGLAMVYTHRGQVGIPSSSDLTVLTYDNATADAAKLHIEHSSAAGGGPTPIPDNARRIRDRVRHIVTR
jgi:hypothetical protein